MSEHAAGAFTGEVAAGMLVEFGCRYAIVGHSERRQLHGETDAIVGAKARAAHGGGTDADRMRRRNAGGARAGATAAVVARQLDAVIDALGDNVRDAVVAYEPVWAIGTGRTARQRRRRRCMRRCAAQLATWALSK